MHTKSVPLGDKEQPGVKELFTDYSQVPKYEYSY